MWSDKYNPMTCFDALYSSSEGLGLENLGKILYFVFSLFCKGEICRMPLAGTFDPDTEKYEPKTLKKLVHFTEYTKTTNQRSIV
jgi:hypothetical protein